MWYGLAADVVALTHSLFVGFVVWSEALIVLGRLLGWGWVRNLRFRLIHIGLVGYVFVQDLLGRICPLTIWERDLREMAGQTASTRSFIGNVVHTLLMCDMDEQTLRTIRISFAVVVLLTFVLIPPRWSRAETPNVPEGNAGPTAG